MENSDSRGSVSDVASNSGTECERTINEEVAYAESVRRRVDDLTAKRIARELDPGSGPLHELAETGAISPDMEVDLSVAEEVARDLGLDTHIPWIAALRRYCNGRLLTSWVPYWNHLHIG